jgi:molybdate transport system substrate-binding protein
LDCNETICNSFGLAIAVTLGFSNTTALADELRVISNSSLKYVFEQLVPDFEKSTGHRVTIEYSPPAVGSKRVLDGEPFDIVFNNRSMLDELAKANKIQVATRTEIASYKIGVGVRRGTPNPDLKDVEAFKQAVLEAKSLGLGDPKSGSVPGRHMRNIFTQMGIAEQLAPKIKLYFGGVALAHAVAVGEAEMGISTSSELMGDPGVNFAGPLPAEIQNISTMLGAATSGTAHSESAMAFISFVHRPVWSEMFKTRGLDLI